MQVQVMRIFRNNFFRSLYNHACDAAFVAVAGLNKSAWRCFGEKKEGLGEL